VRLPAPEASDATSKSTQGATRRAGGDAPAARSVVQYPKASDPPKNNHPLERTEAEIGSTLQLLIKAGPDLVNLSGML